MIDVIVVSARDMSKKERKIYEQANSQIQERGRRTGFLERKRFLRIPELEERRAGFISEFETMNSIYFPAFARIAFRYLAPNG